ncbi:hypothetical protein GCM10023165_19860 [Variovorax defluvii]|uniref:Uncharacterized protein n=1 Tax=Variovorax defluvii TaxID=913761 RepID=A0ABP8HJJ2_9BURK
MNKYPGDPAAGRAFRRMALLLAILVIGGVAALFVWIKEPAGTTIEPTGGPEAAGASGGVARQPAE